MTLFCMKLWFHDIYTNLRQIFNNEIKDSPNDKCLADYEYKKGDSFGLISGHIRHIVYNNFNV